VALSALDLFSVGIGPSSSHTVGPMRAAARVVRDLEASGLLARVAAVRVELFGSLGLTGRGHGTDKALVLGLGGDEPDAVDPDSIPERLARVASSGRLPLLGRHPVPFGDDALVFHRRKVLPAHPNGLRFALSDADGTVLVERVAYSVGGGFVTWEGDPPEREPPAVPHPFRSGDELLARCAETGLSISSLMLANERAFRPEAETRARLMRVWEVMQACVRRGCEREGILPGGLKVVRRAASLYRRLRVRPPSDDALAALDWVNLWALAVNEENAAGGQVVTAPTNGAAGIIPAVLHYHRRFGGHPDDDSVVRFLLTAGAIGLLFKQNASISGAEVGCQGEVGVACSMAAAGLAEVLGGTPRQVENAAEIGMEHNLGLTCDPVGGLVQVPCIERNAMGAVKAINAARLALQGDGEHKVSLDKVIATMRQTGADMKAHYKETARGGLAVNVVEC
jgi:L-serine dehydratase